MNLCLAGSAGSSATNAAATNGTTNPVIEEMPLVSPETVPEKDGATSITYSQAGTRKPFRVKAGNIGGHRF